MSQPDLIASHLDGEEAVATVNLSGEDALVVTPTRSLRYESEGILSDESVTEYPHDDVESIGVSSGRRKATITLTYPLEGERTLQVGTNRRDTVLHYLLAGVFHAKGITDPGESLHSVFQFNELTLAITSKRILTHVGAQVWDPEYEEYPFAEFTGLTFEEGNIATEMVLYLDDRPQRVKVPNERAEEVKRALEETLVASFDVESLEAFEAASGVPEQNSEDAAATALSFEDGVRPLGAEDPEPEPTAEPDEETWPYEDTADLEIDELREAVERLEAELAEQQELLAAQQRALADLAEQLPDR